MNIPRVVIAAPSSGCGKTTITVGLMAALAEHMTVQGFKAGPDFIDPGYHSAATGRASRNLDTWMVPPETVLSLFARANDGVDAAIIEGVMGLYDGLDGLTETGSTAQLAKLLKSPVILVIDAASMARSAGALALGFRMFDQDINLAGIIANNLAGEAHARWVSESIESVGLKVLGCIPRETFLHVPERHLGLHTATEKASQTTAFIAAAKKAVEENVDMEQLIRIAHSAPELAITLESQVSCWSEKRERIAIAYDQAFCFYYEDNFDLLREAGAELVFFSPLQDENLPPDISGLYLGGGYPELHAVQIHSNQPMRAVIKACIQANMPVYAECGGLMALADNFQQADASQLQMIGALPGFTRLSGRLTLGYREVTALQSNILLGKAETARGHEFHYSEWIRPEAKNAFAYRLQSRAGMPSEEGFARGNLLASYVHLHFASNPNLARNFVNACRNWREERQRKSR